MLIAHSWLVNINLIARNVRLILGLQYNAWKLAPWRSSYAAVCKTAYTGANPVGASRFSRYFMTNDKRRVYVAGLLLINDKHELYLLHKISNDWWELPGGKLEVNETPEVAAIREGKEELGVDSLLVGNKHSIEYVHEDILFDYTAFTARVVSGSPKPIEIDIHDAGDFFNLRQLITRKAYLSPIAKTMVQKIIDGEIKL